MNGVKCIGLITTGFFVVFFLCLVYSGQYFRITFSLISTLYHERNSNFKKDIEMDYIIEANSS